MHDPYFDAAVADIRGFDLDDDAPVLAALEADGDGLPAPERLLRAVLRLRADRPTQAIEDLDRIAAVGHAVSVAHYLQSGIAARLGQLDQAEDALVRARRAAQADGLVPTCDLLHAEGLVSWRRHALDDALAKIDAGLEADDSEPRRWLDRAALARLLGRPDEAREALERALELDPELAFAQWELAIALVQADRLAEAVPLFHRALASDPSLRDRTATDERLELVRTLPQLAVCLGPPAAPDLRWLAQAPSWLQSLAADPALEGMSVAFLSANDRERLRHALHDAWARGPVGTLHTAATLEESRRRVATMRPVALGPATRTRAGVTQPSVLWLDEATPDRLWLAPSDAFPPFLWIDVGSSTSTLAKALRECSRGGAPCRDDLQCSARGFLGYLGHLMLPSPYGGELEASGIAGLEQHLSLSPFLESGAWGSAFADDPWPDVIPPQPGLALKLEQRQREVAAQAHGHPWSMTWRLRHSRAHFTIELHHHELLIAEVRYEPSPHRDVVARMNATFGCEYPLDLPIDAVATLLGFPFDGAADLEPALERSDDHDEIAGLLLVLSALRHGELDAHALWRRFAGHPAESVRATVANIALAYNFEALLEERSLLEPDPALKEEIETALDEGILAPDWDPWATQSDEDEDEDEVRS